MVVEASETDINKVYLEFADQVPANNQQGDPPKSREGSLSGSSVKMGDSRHKRSNTRLGVSNKTKVPAPQVV